MVVVNEHDDDDNFKEWTYSVTQSIYGLLCTPAPLASAIKCRLWNCAAQKKRTRFDDSKDFRCDAAR